MDRSSNVLVSFTTVQKSNIVVRIYDILHMCIGRQNSFEIAVIDFVSLFILLKYLVFGTR